MLWNRVRNEVVSRVQVERQLSSKVDQCVLRWFGHVERMVEECMVEKVIISDVEGNCCRGRPRLGWMDGVKRAFTERFMSMKQSRQNALDRRG